MKTAADVNRAKALLLTMTDAKEWRETIENAKGAGAAYCRFEEFYMCGDPEFRKTMQGYEGDFRMPRDVALDMMKWLEAHARAELDKIGVKV